MLSHGIYEKSHFISFTKLASNGFTDVLMKYFCLTSSLLMNHGGQTSKQRKYHIVVYNSQKEVGGSMESLKENISIR